MNGVDINYLAVLLAAVASMVIGSLWYGPLFGKVFMKAMGMEGMTPEQKQSMQKAMIWNYVGQLVASLVMFFVLAWFIGAVGDGAMMTALKTAFWGWLGFVVPVKAGDALWGGKKELFWLGVGNMLVTLLTAAAIIAALQ